MDHNQCATDKNEAKLPRDPEDPFRPIRALSYGWQEEEEEHVNKFTMRQLVSFGVLVSLCTLSFVLWKTEVMGASRFPWFVICIGIFLVAWALHYWISRALKLSPDSTKRKKTFFYLHLSLFTIIGGVLLITSSSVPTDITYWPIIPLAPLAILLSIHFTWIFTPEKWRWFTVQLFIYLLVVGGDFAIWYLSPDTGEWWLYIALVYGGILILQMLVYAFVARCTVPSPLKFGRGIVTKVMGPNTRLIHDASHPGYNTYPQRKVFLNKPFKFKSWSEKYSSRVHRIKYPGSVIPSRALYSRIPAEDWTSDNVSINSNNGGNTNNDIDDIVVFENDEAPNPQKFTPEEILAKISDSSPTLVENFHTKSKPRNIANTETSDSSHEKFSESSTSESLGSSIGYIIEVFETGTEMHTVSPTVEKKFGKKNSKKGLAIAALT